MWLSAHDDVAILDEEIPGGKISRNIRTIIRRTANRQNTRRRLLRFFPNYRSHLHCSKRCRYHNCQSFQRRW
jgi:hypothetical protein